MKSLAELVRECKNGSEAAFLEILQRFEPLVKAWLKQTYEMFGKQKEDYQSMAKIVMLECIKNFDESKNVPFESYFKIQLYHFYSNHKRKKEVEVVYLKDDAEIRAEKNTLEDKVIGKLFIESLGEDDRCLLMLIMKGYTIEQISEVMKIKAKTIKNRKYDIIKKFKDYERGI